MDRRHYLRGLAVGGTTSLLAGCLGSLGGLGGDAASHTYLPKSTMAKKVDSNDLPYPAWGQQLPSVTLPAPLEDESVTTTQFEGSRNVLLTVFYSHCPEPTPTNSAICRLMLSQLRNVQADAESNGYADDLAFLAITFDPVRDTAERLRTFADEMHIDLSAGNWYFLRPPTPRRAEAVVHGTFGIKFVKTTPTPSGGSTPTSNGAATSSGTETSGGGTAASAGTTTTASGPAGNATADTPPGSGSSSNYSFNHSEMAFLVNVDGYVERVYRYESRGNPPWQDRRDDVKRLLAKEG